MFHRWTFVSLLLALGCGGSGGGKTPVSHTPCDKGELAACGRACSSVSECPAGLYCSEGSCTAECTTSTLPRDCGSAAVCSGDGHCMTAAMTAQADAGNSTYDDGASNTCAKVELDAHPVTPNVTLVIDQSGSMTEKFGTSTRWDVLKASLLANNGLIAELQNQVRFGLALYSGKDTKQCPLITRVDYAIGNLEAIRAVYQPAKPIDNTPTGDSIDAIVDALQSDTLDKGDGPDILIVATDGEPDTCEVPNPQNGQAEAVAAVTRAFSMGIRTYMIAVAEEKDISQAHLRDMANAGAGVPSGGPDAPSYRVKDDQGLRDALRSIVQGQLSCTVHLEGKVTAEDPCVGDVRLGGEAIECNGADGFKLVDPSTMELVGKACDALKRGVPLTATFPCDAAIVI